MRPLRTAVSRASARAGLLCASILRNVPRGLFGEFAFEGFELFAGEDVGRAGDGDEAEDAEDEAENEPACGSVVLLAGKPGGKHGADNRLRGEQGKGRCKQFW